MMKVTVVIPNWNGMEWLGNCLTSLRAQTIPLCVIMIDNGSDDESVAYVREHFPEVKIRAFHKNTGFCAAVNEGITLCRTEYVILLNNDITCDPMFAQKLLEAIERHPGSFSVSARMMQMHDPERIDDAGDYYCALGWAFADGKGCKAQARMKEKKIFSACAGAAIYRKEVFDRIGMFDVKHFAYLEDVDVGYRARLAGYENWYAPEAVVYHAGSAASGSRYNTFKTSCTSRNSVYLIRKNMPAWQIALNLPFLLAGFAVKTAFFIKKGMGKQYVKGLIEGLSMKNTTVPDRRTIRSKGNKGNYLEIQMELWINVIRRFRRGEKD